MDNDKRTTREGWYNRHLTALPNKECVINIIHKDIDGEHEHLCEWKPFNKSEYTSANMPGEGYLGTATVIKPPFEGIGFHAWEQNNSQFIYYKIIEHPTTETETKKEKGKEGDILAHENYPFGSTAEIGSRDRSLYEHKKESFIAGYNTLAKENKELKEELDLSNIQILALQNKLSGCESALETAYEQNKLLREALEMVYKRLHIFGESNVWEDEDEMALHRAQKALTQ